MNLVELSQDFLITWNYFYTAVEKEVALMKGRSFGEQLIVFLLKRCNCDMFMCVEGRGE